MCAEAPARNADLPDTQPLPLPVVRPLGRCRRQQVVELQPQDLLVSSYLRGDLQSLYSTGLQHQLYEWQVGVQGRAFAFGGEASVTLHTWVENSGVGGWVGGWE